MQLGTRKQLILRAIVRDYVQTAEPVGSEALADRHDLGVKPATLRNEMAEMSEWGYLRQPHTSAGRIPSDKGYRFYVDWLIRPRRLSSMHQQRLRAQIERSRAEVERVLHQTCRLLSALTHHISMVTAPEVERDVVRQVHLASLDRSRLLVVLALASGRVEHATVLVGADLMSVDLRRSERLVCAEMAGRTVGESAEIPSLPAEPAPADGDHVYRAVKAAVLEAMGRIQREESGEIYLDGAAAVLRQPEFVHGDTVRGLMEVLEERRQLLSLLRAAYDQEARVVIGSESGDPRMQMCSLVAARYMVMGRYVGAIGVLGPTRMDYDRTVPAVRFMARSLGEVLTRMSL